MLQFLIHDLWRGLQYESHDVRRVPLVEQELLSIYRTHELTTAY